MLNAFFMNIIILLAIVYITVYVVTAVFYMKIFAKANVAAWKAWVPVVNTWKFLQLGGYPGAFSLLYFAGILLMRIYLVYNIKIMLEGYSVLFTYGQYNSFFTETTVISLVLYLLGFLAYTPAAVFCCMSAYQISRKLAKEGVWVVLYIFLTPAWLGIMAFDKSVWNDSLAKPAKGPERPPSWEPSAVSQHPAPASQYPAPGQVSHQPAPGQIYYQPAPPQYSGLAIASLVCGILGLFLFFPAIVAIITGAMGLKKPAGKGLAISGLVLGIFAVFVWLIAIAVIVVYILFAVSL